MVRLTTRAVMMIAAVLIAGGAAATFAQFVGNSPSRASTLAHPVQFVYPEQVHLPAGKPSNLALHFRVADGMHINSHTPHDAYLIPTEFTIPPASGVRLESARYPAGSDITLPSDPKTRLDVYTGDFAIETRVLARPGNHLVRGKLHFQACNLTQCLPPQTITAAIDIIAK